MNTTDPQHAELKKDLDATVRARRELGDDYDSALVDSFLEKVEQRIDDAVDRRVRRHLAEQRVTTARGVRAPNAADTWFERHGFALVSLIVAIPLSAIGGAFGGMSGVLAAWIGVVGVNVAQTARVNPEIFAGRRERGQERERRTDAAGR
ncbi:hypothetical protein OIB37_15850 [Streptomyces sp. NBC_00820]|uniref:hypothetical protein n=1 Tax=Streptomyces sp. NBC_00820 TaxID=2975842 RepID=UPI002ED0744F|nr:hypothetical protein OIB37_15850 [Streptomyces sp. NBC_00820]